MKRNSSLFLSTIGTFVLLLNIIGIQICQGAYPCVLRVAKTDCWPNFQITIQPVDASTQQPIGAPVVIDKNAYETEVLIPCQPQQEISFVATTLPTVWGATASTQYPSTHFWEAPKHLPAGANRWIISLCFASDFSSVPVPLSQKPTCTCSFPPIQDTAVSYSPSL
jgi:hypothetical protein